MPQQKQKPRTRYNAHYNLFDRLIFLAVAAISGYLLITGIADIAQAPAADQGIKAVTLALNLIALITSTFYMLLGVKGRRSNFIFSIFSVSACAVLAWMEQFYGSAAMNFFYYLPCAFIGYGLWTRNSNKKHEVIARKLTPRQLIIVLALTTTASVGTKVVLDLAGGASTSLDGPATIISIVANILVLLRYREQWLFWLATDALQLIMWTTTDNLAMLTLRILYPITAIYGYINWRKLVKSPKSKSKSPQK